jgi:excisionase family DNA binding protein
MTMPTGRRSLAPVPALDELAADPGKAAALTVDAARTLLARCVVAHGVLVARLLEASTNGAEASQTADGNRLLDVEQAAARLGVSTDWLYRRAGTLPFAVRLGRAVRFSAAGIDRYIQQRQGR